MKFTILFEWRKKKHQKFRTYSLNSLNCVTLTTHCDCIIGVIFGACSLKLFDIKNEQTNKQEKKKTTNGGSWKESLITMGLVVFVPYFPHFNSHFVQHLRDDFMSASFSALDNSFQKLSKTKRSKNKTFWDKRNHFVLHIFNDICSNALFVSSIYKTDCNMSAKSWN